MMNELHMKKCQVFRIHRFRSFIKRSSKTEVKYMQIFKKIIDVRKTAWYLLLKKEIILKANLLKGRDAKPEGAKVRKFDQVSRLPLFPYHIWKRCENGRDFDNFYTIQMCDFKKYSRDTGIFCQVSFLYVKINTKTMYQQGQVLCIQITVG